MKYRVTALNREEHYYPWELEILSLYQDSWYHMTQAMYDMERWLDQNSVAYSRVQWRLYFRDEQDLMLFLLRWN